MLTIAAATWISGCKHPPPPSDDDDPPDTDTELPSTTGTTGTTADTGRRGTADTSNPHPECEMARPVATIVRFHDYVDSSEDFTFDEEGYLWGVSVSSGGLIRTPLDGTREMMRPDISSWGRGVRIIADGDFVIAEPDRGSLIRIDRQSMGTEVVHGGYNQPNGIAINDQGIVHLTQAAGGVWRVDPDSGQQTLLHDSPVSTDGITFAPDYRRLYWDSEYGEVVTMLFDDDGEVLEAPNILTTLPVGGGGGLSILDGMAADVCGNLYVVVMNGYIARVLPDGTQEMLIDLSSHPSGTFICAANFGSGIGGWERDHLYVMSLTSGLFEIDVGIEGRPEFHL